MRNTLFQFVLRPLVRGLVMMGCGSVWAAPPVPTQLPTGGQVVAGKAAIAQSSSVLNVNQSSQRAAIDWQSFNVGAAAQVNFNQPSRASVTLNRVLDNNPSQIFGRITAPGQVFLVNPAGAYFAPSASVEVGSLMATTHSLSNEDFMAGRSTLLRNGATGRIVNDGQLKASMEGYIALLAPEVRNNGVVVAQMGTVVLAAGEAYTLQFDGAGLLPNVVVTPATINALVENGNAVQAPGGLIILSAQAASRLQGGMVNNTGSLQASGLVKEGGRILLRASDQISHSGSMQADAALGSAGQGGNITLIADLNNPDSVTRVSGSISAKGGTLGGDGGFVETSASRLKIADSSVIDTLAIRGKNGQWLLDPYDFTIAKSGGDLTGSVLSAALENNSVTIQTTGGNANCTGATCGSGNGNGNGDIFVNDEVSWDSANTLTLNAWRNIAINANMTSSAGKLALVYGQNAVPEGNQAVISIGTNAKINLSAGLNYSTRLGSNGTTDNWTVITALGSEGSTTKTDLQGINGNLLGNYVLGKDIDASSTSNWNKIPGTDTYAGFLPFGIYENGNYFRGKFDGLGHTISRLFVNRPASDIAGLFGLTFVATIRNVGLVDVNISGKDDVGGLVGFAYNSSISHSFVTGTVTGKEGSNVGGLVGNLSDKSKVSQSYATASVSGNGAGGLVGIARVNSDIYQSYATGTVEGEATNNGGLVGFLDNSSVSQSYATGAVSSGNSMNGGLVGFAGPGSLISKSYAIGAVSGVFYAAGLVGGMKSATIDESYATGKVSLKEGRGGWGVGGLVAEDQGGNTVTKSYWNKETTGQTTSAVGGTGLTAAEFQKFSIFKDAGWSIANAGGSDNVWRIYEGQTTPLLKAFLTNITLSGTDTTTTYNGKPQSNTFVATIGTINDGDITGVDGLVTQTNAGTTTSGGTLSNAKGEFYKYDISYGGGGSLTIDKAPLNISDLSAISRPYNGSTAVDLEGEGRLSGFKYGEDVVTLTGSTSTKKGTLASANAGLQTVTVDSQSYWLTGDAKDNYQLISDLTVKISKADVTLSAIQKTYDGTSGLGNTTMTIAGVGTEKLGFSAATYYSKDVSANGSNYLSALTLENGSKGEKESNYKLPALNLTNAPATINKAPLTLAGSNATVTYNGREQRNGFTAADGTTIYNNDIISVSGLVTATNASNTAYTNSADLSDAQGGGIGNYTITYGTSGTLKIDRATVSLSGISKTYDGTSGLGNTTMTIAGVGSEKLGFSAATYYSKDVSANGSNYLSALTLENGSKGELASNYKVPDTLSVTNAPATINKAPLTLAGSNATVTYNGREQRNGFTATDGTTIYNNDIISVSGLVTATNASNTAYTNSADLSDAQGSGVGNYTITYGASGTLKIDRATVSLSGISKTYDGTSGLGNTTMTIAGVGSEKLGFSAATYYSKDVSANGSNYLSALTLENGSKGELASNYKVPDTLSVTNAPAMINKAPLTLKGSDTTVTYNGREQRNEFTATNGTTIYNNDIESVSGLATGRNASPDLYRGAAKLSNAQGSGVGNYEIIYGDGGSLKIDKADYTAISASKTYNGNADFSSATLSGVNDEQFSVSSLTANSPNASSNDGARRFTSFSGGISGVSTAADIGNYNTLVLSSLSDGANQATIIKAPLTLKGSDTTVTYSGREQRTGFAATDGTTIYNSNDIESVSGLATGRNASSTSYSGAALLSNAQGSGIGNYEIIYGAGGSLTINKAPLTINASSDSRTYNGSTTSDASPSYGTLYGTDSLTGLSQSFATKNVMGENQSTLRVNNGFLLNDGNGGGNYEVTLVNAAGTITPAKLNITGVSVANKVYDGARTASLSGGDVQVFGNDDVTLVKTAVTGTFDTKDAGSAKLVSAKGYTLSGSDVSNYALIQPTELLAAITPKALTIAAKNDFRTYDSMAYSGGNGVTYSGFVTGESESALSGTLAYGGTSQGAVRVGTYSISPRGLTSNNYSIGFVDGQLTIASPVSTTVTGGCSTASLAATRPTSMACYTQNMRSRRVRSFEQFDVDAKQ